MKEYLYKKKYSLLNTGSIHLTNPENMLKYIDLKVNELVNDDDKGTRLGIKLRILNEFYEILKYDLENSEIPIPFGYFENPKEEKEFQNNKIKADTVVYYLSNICLNYHTKLIGSNLINRIPIVSNSYKVKKQYLQVKHM